MNDTTDINLVESSGISGGTYAGGVFSATASSGDPNLYLLNPGIASSQRDGKTGKNFRSTRRLTACSRFEWT